MRGRWALIVGLALLAMAAAIFGLLRSDLRYDPAYETLWLDGAKWSLLAIVLGAGGVVLLGRHLALRVINKLARTGGALVACLGIAVLLLAIFVALSGGAFVFGRHSTLHRLRTPDGAPVILEMVRALSPRARLHTRDEAGGWSEVEWRYTLSDPPFEVRESPRPGRLLVVGDRMVIAVIVDLAEQRLHVPDRKKSDLEAIRKEFGEDLWLSYPGYHGRPPRPER